MYGRIESAWRRVDNGIEYRFTIPANTRATLMLHGKKPKVLKSGTYKMIVKE